MTLIGKRSIFFALLTIVILLFMKQVFNPQRLPRSVLAIFATEPPYMKIDEETFAVAKAKLANRRKALQNQCHELGHLISRRHVLYDPPDNIIVDVRHKLLYCPVAKAACTSWKQFYLKLRGVKPRPDVHVQAKEELTYLHQFGLEERRRILTNFTKVIIVRHPMTRLLSAFRNKLQPNGTYENLKKKTNADDDLLYYWRDHVGKVILTKYRGKEVADEMFVHKEKYNLTFQEFVSYLVQYPKSVPGNNRHWKEMHKTCYPCDIQYDIIGKFESLLKDSLVFLRMQQIPEHFPMEARAATNSANGTVAANLYNTLPKELIQKVYQRYEYDFQLFSYDFDHVSPMKGIDHEETNDKFDQLKLQLRVTSSSK